MAIDTRAKRLSMMNFVTEAVISDLLPDPDGTIDTGDKQTFLNKYSGIIFAGAPAAERTPTLLLLGVG